MPDSKAGGYISRVQFKNGESIELLQNDIVVFVGPNNAGKSQTIFYKGIMPSEKVLDLPMDCNTLTGSVNL